MILCKSNSLPRSWIIRCQNSVVLLPTMVAIHYNLLSKVHVLDVNNSVKSPWTLYSIYLSSPSPGGHKALNLEHYIDEIFQCCKNVLQCMIIISNKYIYFLIVQVLNPLL